MTDSIWTFVIPFTVGFVLVFGAIELSKHLDHKRRDGNRR